MDLPWESFYCECSSSRRNPDDQIRNLERRASQSDDNSDWDRYFAAIERTGELAYRLDSIVRRFLLEDTVGLEGIIESRGGEIRNGGIVSQEEAIFLTRVLGYRYRAGLLPLEEIRNDLRHWDTDRIRIQVMANLRLAESGSWAVTRGQAKKMPSNARGFFWLRKPISAHPNWGRTSSPLPSQNFWPFHLYASNETPKMPRKKAQPYFHRLFLICPICMMEVPSGRVWNHFEAEDHGGKPRKQERPIMVIARMVARRLSELTGINPENPLLSDIRISTTGGQISITVLPEYAPAFIEYMETLGMHAPGPPTQVQAWEEGDYVTLIDDPRRVYTFVRKPAPKR